MCGRFSLTQSTATIAQTFQIAEVPTLTPRYNIAPTQSIATLNRPDKGTPRQFQWMRWGLIPSWAKDVKIGNRLINARVETVTEKPSFRDSLKHKRCLILADGFYEWQKLENRKQPYYFQLKNSKPFAFAGLWSQWQPERGEAILSCTIITTTANELVQSVHERMPIILSPEVYDRWLDPELTHPESILDLLKPYASEKMQAIPVSSLVNNPANDRPECVQQLA
ncbi:SOS response-associated peptidase [Pleurocapsales cyanobacterium LEGE 06147]|nr:SOS response-associated peptidase [Pleurocapsales cyanobacterium LEGE 06147]